MSIISIYNINKTAIIKKALDISIIEGISFDTFTRITRVPLDTIFVDRFFHNLQEDMPIYFNNTNIEYFGYNGTIKKQKESIKRLINTNFSEYEDILWWDYSNNEYGEFYESQTQEEPPLESLKAHQCAFTKLATKQYPIVEYGRNKNKTKHILVMPDMFREMLMLCKTDKGKIIRHYYITLVKILELYKEYQLIFRQRSINRKDDVITRLENTINENERKAELSRKKQEEQFNRLIGIASESKEELGDINEELGYINEELYETREDFTSAITILDKTTKALTNNTETLVEVKGELIETNKDLIGVKNVLEETTNIVCKIAQERVIEKRIPSEKKSYLVIVKDLKDNDLPYYVIRNQKRAIKSSIRILGDKHPGAYIVRILKIRHPNAIAFWEDIKQKYNKYIGSTDGNWFNLYNCDEEKFIRKIKKLNQARLDAVLFE